MDFFLGFQLVYFQLWYFKAEEVTDSFQKWFWCADSVLLTVKLSAW